MYGAVCFLLIGSINFVINLDPKLLFITILICFFAIGISNSVKASVERPEIEICGAE